MKKTSVIIILLTMSSAALLSGCTSDYNYGAMVTKNVLLFDGDVFMTCHATNRAYKDADTEITFIFREKGDYTIRLSYGEGMLYEHAINVTQTPYSHAWRYSEETTVNIIIQHEGQEELYKFEGKI